jgi:hypothetical protein
MFGLRGQMQHRNILMAAASIRESENLDEKALKHIFSVVNRHQAWACVVAWCLDLLRDGALSIGMVQYHSLPEQHSAKIHTPFY